MTLRPVSLSSTASSNRPCSSLTRWRPMPSSVLRLWLLSVVCTWSAVWTRIRDAGSTARGSAVCGGTSNSSSAVSRNCRRGSQMFLQWWFPIGGLYGFQSERTAQMVYGGEEGIHGKIKKKEKNNRNQNFGTGLLDLLILQDHCRITAGSPHDHRTTGNDPFTEQEQEHHLALNMTHGCPLHFWTGRVI